MEDKIDVLDSTLQDILDFIPKWWDGLTNLLGQLPEQIIGVATQAPAEEAADSASTMFELPDISQLIPSVDSVVYIAAFVWLLIVLLTHTSWWKRLEQVRIPMPLTFALGAVMAVLLVSSLVWIAGQGSLIWVVYLPLSAVIIAVLLAPFVIVWSFIELILYPDKK